MIVTVSQHTAAVEDEFQWHHHLLMLHAALDLFKSDKKTVLLKDLLSNFTQSGGPTSDPIIVHTVFDIAGVSRLAG